MKIWFFLVGIALIGWGYHLLAISPDSSAEEMLSRAKQGMLSVISGGTLLMLWLAKRGSLPYFFDHQPRR